MLSTYDLASGKPAFIVLPVEKNVRVLVTGGDVLHSWAMPAFGVKKDAVPGRLNETWFRIDKPGIYYGQCSEICGTNHAYMPIEIRAVPNEQFTQWAGMMKKDAPGAMDYIQTQTLQYAHAQMDMPHLTLKGFWGGTAKTLADKRTKLRWHIHRTGLIYRMPKSCTAMTKTMIITVMNTTRPGFSPAGYSRPIIKTLVHCI